MRKIGSFKFFAILVSIVLSQLSFSAAAQVKVFATVDRNEMGVGDTFTYSIQVTSESAVQIQEPRLPNLSRFELINSWKGSESRSTFTNGTFQVEQTRSFNYMLAPKEKGTLKIPSVSVVVNGETYNTKGITLQVVDAGQGPRAQGPPKPRGMPDPFEDLDEMFSQLLQRREQALEQLPQEVDPKKAFFIHANVDKEEAYVGEQVTASWYLYTRGQIRDIDTLKYPSLNGFWKEEIELATRLNFEQVVINGLPYKRARLAAFALFPIKSGEAIIDPYKAKCTVINSRLGGFGRAYQYTRASEVVKIKVKELPVESRPKDFSGAVGQFNVTAKIEGQNVPVNQPVPLKIRFEGHGNAKLIDLPPLELPPSIELYDTKAESKFFKNGKSFKEFELLLIPRAAGQVQIPSISVSAFDSESEQYYSKATEALTLNVVPGAKGSGIESSPLSATGDEEDNQPRLPGLALEFNNKAQMNGRQQTLFWSLLYVLAFGFLGWRGFVELGFGQKKKDLEKILQHRIKKIEGHAAGGEWRQTGVEATNLVYLVLGELSRQGGANLEIAKLFKKASPSIRRELEEPVTQLMNKLERLSFAPEEAIGELKQKKHLHSLVKETENLLSKAIRVGVKGLTETDSKPA